MNEKQQELINENFQGAAMRKTGKMPKHLGIFST